MSAELPQIIAEIAEIAGPDAAWALAREHGGTTVFIPAEATRDDWLSRLVGFEAAAKVCAHYRITSGEGRANGIRLLIPMASAARDAERWRQALEAGLSARDTARQLGVHERTVYRHRAQERDERQMKLFE